MGYLIGTDEAGYGPNLGPLVVSATVWEVPDGVSSGDLFRRLEGAVVSTPGRVARSGHASVAIADSKTLYQPGGGLRNLERGLLAALAVLHRFPTDWQGVWEAVAPDSADARQSIPWYADYHAPVPLDADANETAPLAGTLSDALSAAGVRLVDVRGRAVFPEQFNGLVRRHDSKGAALSHVTLDLVAQLCEPLAKGPISVVCDKHGGRNRYARLLADHFPEWLIEIHGEGRTESVYRFGPEQRRVEFRFQAKAESHLPVALASMASKYLRELAMRALNAFWRGRVDGLSPTAGYPQDAKRFKAHIAAAQDEMGIGDELVWRVR